MCVDIEEQAVELRNGHVNHQNSHHRSNDGNVFFCKWRNRSYPGPARISRSVHWETHCIHPNTPDRLYPGQPHSAIAFQSPSVHGKDTSKAREIHFGEGCGYSGRNSYEQQVISKEFTRIQRSNPGFHEIERLPNIDPNVTTELWLEQLKLESNRVRFETCWYKSVNITPA